MFLVQFSSLSETLTFKRHVRTVLLYFLLSVVSQTDRLEVFENRMLAKIFGPRGDTGRQFRVCSKLFVCVQFT
jgi:hypothetical protein